MKYLYLPIHLLKFWFLESPKVILRSWKNIILYLEEDLAVGLMFKLLFTPLFHDSSIVGRLLSFSFRLIRICIGLVAFLGVSVLAAVLLVVWLALPLAAIIEPGTIALICRLLLFSGVVLFINHLVSHPHQKLRQVKDFTKIWKASFVGKNDVSFTKLLKTYPVKKLLLYLEQTPESFTGLNDIDSDEVFKKVYELGNSLKLPYLSQEHFFVAKLYLVPGIEEQLLKLGLKLGDFLDALSFLKKKADTWRVILPWDEDFKVHHLKGVNRGWMGVQTPTLDSVCDDITREAAKQYIPDFVGRPEVVKRVIDILSLEQGQNVALIGEPGSGRGALISYLAKLIISGDAPKALATKRLVKLDISRLMAGITNEGDLAARLKSIFDEVKFSGNIIVYVDEIQDLGLGEAGNQFNLYALILPYLESSDFQFVAVADSASYTKTVEKNKSFARIFTKVELPPASVAETVGVLINRAIEVERYKKICTTVPAIHAIAELSNRYIHDSVLPDIALKVFEESLGAAEDGWIKKLVVEKAIQNRSNIPIAGAGSETTKQLLNLEDLIHQKMIDQEEAVLAVSKALRRAAAELRDNKRPIGSFLFVGPTGVGKTELAKTLVDVYFAGKGYFARFDMSEYQTPEAIDRLIGGNNEEGQLTETVRQHPYSLVLLDEFEKADPKILTLFLQVLDDGRLTSGTGRTVDFTNTIIIATSNAASVTIAKGLEAGQGMDQLKKVVSDELITVFRPELVNRFDEVVIFKPLSPTDLQQVVKLKLSELQKQLKNQGFEIDFDQKLIEGLAQKGYDPVLGARPLRRLIQDTLEAKLSVMILENKLPKGQKFLASEQLLN